LSSNQIESSCERLTGMICGKLKLDLEF